MTRVEAERIAREYLRTQEAEGAPELVLLVNETLERSFGWVFFYDSRSHHETGNIQDAIAGNAPIVVTKADGRIHVTGTAYPLEHYLRQYSE